MRISDSSSDVCSSDLPVGITDRKTRSHFSRSCFIGAPMSSIPKPQRIRGTQDMIGEAAARFVHVVAVFDRVRRLYAFQPVQVPVLEATSVFSRSLRVAPNVVSQEK